MLHLKIVMCELFNSPASASEAGKVTFSIPTFFSLFFDTLFIGQGGGGIEQILSSKKYKQGHLIYIIIIAWVIFRELLSVAFIQM